MAASKLQLEPRGAQDMEIIWGNGVSELNQRWMSECKRSGTWFSHLVSIFTNNASKMVKLRCPYTQTITVAHLLGSSGDTDVARVLKKGAVFYGAAFNLTGDRVVSPVFEEMPGVYLHAMAYDNLVTFRNDYKRAERELLIPSLTGRQISLPLTGVVDALLLFVTVNSIWHEGFPGFLVVLVFTVAAGAGAAIGWFRVHTLEFSLDAESGKVSARATQFGALMIVGLIGLRYLAR